VVKENENGEMRCCHGKSKNKTKREKGLSEWDLTGMSTVKKRQ
jgi:hypothetical protein